MDIDGLAASPIGRLVPILGPDPVNHEVVEGQAFLPDPLPREITLSTPTWNRVNAASAALARLDGAARLMPRPELLRRPALRREAQSTSALEGTYAPFADVLAADRGDEPNNSAEVREILNFESMAELAFSWPEDRPMTLGMLGELQRTLVRDTASELSDAGGLRDRIVVIGARGRGIDQARFVPPPPGDQLRSGVETLLRWIADPLDLPSVVQAAMVHYQFETLHPYSDGNGRLGRLLVIVQLLRGALIREPLLIVSPWFERRRSEYQEALLKLSGDGNWDDWIAFFAEGVTSSAAESQRKVERLVALQTELRTQVQRARKRGVAEQLAADLIGNPYITSQDVSGQYGISGQGAHNAIKTLADLGIIELIGTRSSGAHLYVAPSVVAVVSS
ncbi:MAG TPA: Fic/DOC family N-terminal domain-containing protein [Solirubrobacterales bacterium]|jgi:Fic family protein|nr:Fic/DOC family N-terminal domain-containing protein [Solirubrobacterales bacterium]